MQKQNTKSVQTHTEPPLTPRDLYSQNIEVKLSTGNTVALRPIEVFDISWAQQALGAMEPPQLLQNKNIEGLIRWAFRQLKIEFQKKFKPDEVEYMDEDGNIRLQKLKPYQVFMKNLTGPDLMELYFGLLIAYGAKPEQIDAIKKNVQSLQKEAMKSLKNLGEKENVATK